MLPLDLPLQHQLLGVNDRTIYWILVVDWLGSASNRYSLHCLRLSHSRHSHLCLFLPDNHFRCYRSVLFHRLVKSLRFGRQRGDERVRHSSFMLHSHPMYCCLALFLHRWSQVQLVQVPRGYVWTWRLGRDGKILPGPNDFQAVEYDDGRSSRKVRSQCKHWLERSQVSKKDEGQRAQGKSQR